MRFPSFLVLLGLCGSLLGQTPAAAPAILPGTHISAELKTKLDAKKAQIGEAVRAQISRDVKLQRKTVLPKGSILFGHVTEAVAAESKKSPSHIAVVFDRAETKKHQSIPLHAAIVGVIAPTSMLDMSDLGPNEGMGPDMGMGQMMAPSAMKAPQKENMPDQANDSTPPPAIPPGGAVLGMGDTVQPVNSSGAPMSGAAGATRGMARDSNGNPLLIELPHGRSSGQVGGSLETPKGNLRLDSGTRLILVVQAGAGQP